MQCVGTENVFEHGMLYKEFCKIYNKAVRDFNESYPIRCFPSPSYAYICFLTPLHIAVYSGKRRRFLLSKYLLPSSKIHECGYHSCDAVWASNASSIYVRSSTGFYIYVYSFNVKKNDFTKQKIEQPLITYTNLSVNKLFANCSLNNQNENESPLLLDNHSDGSSLSHESLPTENENHLDEFNLSSPTLLNTFLRQSTNARIDHGVPHIKRVVPLWHGAQKDALEKDSIIYQESKKTLQFLEGYQLNLISTLQFSSSISHIQLAYKNLIILIKQNFLLQVYSLHCLKTPLVRLNLHSLTTDTSEQESWLLIKDESYSEHSSRDSPYFTHKLYHPESITNCIFQCGIQKTDSPLLYQIHYMELNETLDLLAIVFCTGAAAILAWKTSLRNLLLLPKIRKTQKTENLSKSFEDRCIGLILRQRCVMTVRFNTMKKVLAVALHDGTIDVLSLNTTRSSQCHLFHIDPKMIFSYKSIHASTLPLKVSTLCWSFCGQSLCIGWFIGGFIVVSSTGSIIYVKPTLSRTYNQMLSQMSSELVPGESHQVLNENTLKETCSFLNDTREISSDTFLPRNSVSKSVSSSSSEDTVLFENQEGYVLTATWTFAGLSLLLIHSSFPTLISEIPFYRTSPLCLPQKKKNFFEIFPNHFHSTRLLIGSEKLLLRQTTQLCDRSKPYYDIPLSRHHAMKYNWPIQQAVESPDQKYILCVGRKNFMLYSFGLNKWSFWENQHSKTYLTINSLPVGWYTSTIFFVCSKDTNNLISTSFLPLLNDMQLFRVKEKSVYNSTIVSGSRTRFKTTSKETYSLYFFHVYYPLQNKAILANILDLKSKPISIHIISSTDTNLRTTIELKPPHSMYTESSRVLLYNTLEPRKQYLDFQKSASINTKNPLNFKYPPKRNHPCVLVIYDSSYQLTAYTLITPSPLHPSLRTTPCEQSRWLIQRLWVIDLSSTHWIEHPLRLQFIGSYHVLVLHADRTLTLIRFYELPCKAEQSELEASSNNDIFNQWGNTRNDKNFSMLSKKNEKPIRMFHFEESQLLLENVFNFWGDSETQFSYFFPLSSPSLCIFSKNINERIIETYHSHTPENSVIQHEQKQSLSTLVKSVFDKKEQYTDFPVKNTYKEDEFISCLQLTRDNQTTLHNVICGSYIWCETLDSYYLISVSQLLIRNPHKENKPLVTQGLYDYKVIHIMKKKSSFKTSWFTYYVNGIKGSICERVTISTPLVALTSPNHCKYTICFSQMFEQRRFMAHYIVYKILNGNLLHEMSEYQYKLACSFCDMMEGTSQFSSFLEILLFHVFESVSEIFTQEMKLIEANPSSGVLQLLKETICLDFSSNFLLRNVPFCHLRIEPFNEPNFQFSKEKFSQYVFSLTYRQEEEHLVQENSKIHINPSTCFPDPHITMSYSLLAEEFVCNEIYKRFVNYCHFKNNTFTPQVYFVLLLIQKLYKHNSHVQIFVTLLQIVKRYTFWFSYIIISLIRKSCSTLLPLIFFPLSGITLESLYNACISQKQYQVAAFYLVIFQNCFGTLEVRIRFVLPLFTLVLKHHQYFLAKELLVFFIAAYSLPNVIKNIKDADEIIKQNCFSFLSRQHTCCTIAREPSIIHYPRTFGPKEFHPQFHTDSYRKTTINNCSYEENPLLPLLTFQQFEIQLIKSLLSSIVHFQWFQFLTHIYILQLDILPWLTIIKKTLQDYFEIIENRVLGEFEQRNHDITQNFDEAIASKLIKTSCPFLSLIHSFQKQFICDFVKINVTHHQKMKEILVNSLKRMSSTDDHFISGHTINEENDFSLNESINFKDNHTSLQNELRQIMKPLLLKLLPSTSDEITNTLSDTHAESASLCNSFTKDHLSCTSQSISETKQCDLINSTKPSNGIKESSFSFEKQRIINFSDDIIPSGGHVSHNQSQMFLQTLVSIFLALDIYCIPLAICFSISDINFLNYLYQLNPKCKLVALQFMCTRGHELQLSFI